MAVKKLFYSMGEVSEMFDVNPSLIRHWEKNFDAIRPTKNKKGNRMFSPEDVENLKLIYHLVKEQGMTLQGAAKCLKQSGKEVPRDVELMERLQNIRSLLLEVREELKADEGEVLADDFDAPAAMPKSTTRRRVAAEVEDAVEAATDDAADTAVTQSVDDVAVAERKLQAKKGREPKRAKAKADAEPKELFAFYDQSLF